MNLEEKLVGSIQGSFWVEAYQRGYRWSKEEVERLLEDIEEVPLGANYCLQPVVVKQREEGYELIDGQQRLTTLYLIMKYLSPFMDIHYSLEYVTRKSNGEALGSRELLEQIDKVDLAAPSANIDELFIKKAYSYIQNWFRGDKSRMGSFAFKLQNNVNVIWYEADAEESSIAIFTRLNIGKISLTNAELVKALFLSRGRKQTNGAYMGNPYGIDSKMQHEIALEWNAMEKGLHDSQFWNFITNEKEEKYPIRMELFFDLMENKPRDEYNYFTFNRFCRKFKCSDNKRAVWETIVRYYQQLWEWYNDFDLYHQIGYLVAVGHSLKDLLDKAMNEERPLKKSEFKQEVLDQIRQSMVFEKGKGEKRKRIDYAELNYEHHADFIRQLLLLFNVETIRQKRDKDNRFPFERYKHDDSWSLEHIHAQNSESLRTNQEWNEWLTLHKRSLQALAQEQENDSETRKQMEKVGAEIDQVLSHIKDKSYKGSIRDEFDAVAGEVVSLLTAGSDLSQMHSLANMALLTVPKNAALNNATFDVKRMKILEMDKMSDYIPICTKNVFLKYYSSSDTHLHFWAEEDRRCYIKAINQVLYFHKEEDGKEIKLIHEAIHYGYSK